MSNKHRHVIEAIFREPVSSNIQWREVESLLNHPARDGSRTTARASASCSTNMSSSSPSPPRQRNSPSRRSSTCAECLSCGGGELRRTTRRTERSIGLGEVKMKRLVDATTACLDGAAPGLASSRRVIEPWSAG